MGKTLLASAIMAKYSSSQSIYYWKPIQTGSCEDSDSQTVAELSSASNKIFPNHLNFSTPASPDFAAKKENREIESHDLIQETTRLLRDLHLEKNQLIIELAGGVLVPLNSHYRNIDYIQDMGLPVLIAVSCNLGTINHTLLTWEALSSRKIPVLGYIGWGNQETNSDVWEASKESIYRFTGMPCLGEYTMNSILSPENFQKWANSTFDKNGELDKILDINRERLT